MLFKSHKSHGLFLHKHLLRSPTEPIDHLAQAERKVRDKKKGETCWLMKIRQRRSHTNCGSATKGMSKLISSKFQSATEGMSEEISSFQKIAICKPTSCSVTGSVGRRCTLPVTRGIHRCFLTPSAHQTPPGTRCWSLLKRQNPVRVLVGSN